MRAWSVLVAILAVASVRAVPPEPDSAIATALEGDDQCAAGDEQCALNALQLRGEKREQVAQAIPEGEGNMSQNASKAPPQLGSSQFHGWSEAGGKMWGAGSGIESVNRGNVAYYDEGMDAARMHCGGPGCALIVNPPGHRTVEHFHIHLVRYHGYGANLKRQLEEKVCRAHGWQSGGFPCHGKAAFFPGNPPIFSMAMTGGDISHASVIAWPVSCGGGGTIVELAYGCSIEHQIRGDYKSSKR